MPELDNLLVKMAQVEASDLHLKVGMKPRFRIHGRLHDVPNTKELMKEDIERLTSEILSDEQQQVYSETGEIDFGYGNVQTERYRANYFHDYRGPAAVFRRIPRKIPSLRELNLPDSIEAFAHMRAGLVLVTGATGAGKTSTLAALVNIINTLYRKHIITLEEPIEYIHENRKSVVHQRGLHYDFTSFASGIVAALREDPDVILIGEMRDLETIQMACSAAEVGVLVFATLHTNGAAASVDRIIDVFPAEEQPQIRAMLSQSLAGVTSQILLRRVDKEGRIPATEVLFSNMAVANLIREGKTQDVTNVIQAGKAAGMHTLDDALEWLIQRKLVDPEEAFAYAVNKTRFENFLPV